MITASMQARNQLKKKYPKEHREYYLEWLKVLAKRGTKGKEIYPKAYARAYTELNKVHQEEYRLLFEEARKKGHPTNIYS